MLGICRWVTGGWERDMLSEWMDSGVPRVGSSLSQHHEAVFASCSA